jgi:hypothetical protein
VAVIAKAHTQWCVPHFMVLEAWVLCGQLVQVKQPQVHVVTGCRHQPAIWAPGNAVDHVTMTLRMQAGGGGGGGGGSKLCNSAYSV